ncbi:MAG: hypothetical protein Q7O66_00995 [Dehalococcoidia bacterium]|nr:hypothetical protein [Dehalococcoidia bacterium]
MTRIAELHMKYPTIPGDVIVKWEILNRGVRDSADLDKVSGWTPASGTYQSKFDDVTLKQLVDNRPTRLKDGYMLRPFTFYLKSGEGAGLHISPRSPYEIREVGDGKFDLYEGEERVGADIYFPRPKPREGAEPRTSKGTPISRLIKSPRSCFLIMPVRYCEYFATGEQCKFCNFNSGQEDARSIGLDRPVTESLEEIVEAYKIRGSEVTLIEGRFEMGGFANAEHEERIHCTFVENIARATPYKPNFTVHTEAMSRKGMQRLKDVRLDCFAIQLEAWDAGLFADICPGKERHSSYDRWLEALSDAVDVYGVGNVGCKTIGGLSLIAPNGHKTWQEARDSHIEAVRWMIENDIKPDVGHLHLPAGSVYGENDANRAKLPPTEYYLDVFLAHHEAMLEHGLYEKLNKLMHCGLCCSAGNYTGELGILAQAGDWGTYMADVVPEKANWLLQFIRSVASPVAAASPEAI